MTELRQKARESGVYLRVVKNTLVSKAVENTEFACIQDALSGPLLMAFSMEDPGSAARLVKDFSKDHEKLEQNCFYKWSITGSIRARKTIETTDKRPSNKYVDVCDESTCREIRQNACRTTCKTG